MQYGLEIFPYKRVKEKVLEKKKSYNVNVSIVKYVVLFFTCILISRTKLINGRAPFGIAFLISLSIYLNKNSFLICSTGCIVGYLSLIGKCDSIGIYFINISTILSLNYVLGKLDKKKKVLTIISVIMVEFLINNILINRLNISISLISSLLEMVCILPLYFILDHGIICFKDVNTKHLFNNEEIISMGIIISLIVGGTWGISIKGISIMNIVGLSFVLIIGYTCGSSLGASTGVALGVISGMASKEMVMYISIYAVCGMITGLFRETGKWLSGVAFIITFFILDIYLNYFNGFKGIEALIACGIFFCVKDSFYKMLSLELNLNEKKENLGEEYIGKIKGLFTEKLDDFSELLCNISSTLSNLVDNDKLVMKTRSSALIENLADRVCANCNMKSMCWKRELHYTYSAFGELIQNYQGGRYIIPYEIERKCINRTSLMKSTEEIVNKYIINEMRKSSLCEGRELLSSQISSIASTVTEISDQLNCDIYINSSIENRICRILDRHKVNYKEVICVQNKKGRLSVKLTMKACGGKQSCVKNILPLINEAASQCMCVGDESCVLDPKEGLCTITYEQAPKYHIVSYAAVKCKEGENNSGDSYSFSKLKDGTHMCIISDGMGSGPQAARESQAAIELINNFSKAGFDRITAINAINSLVSMRFAEEEKFSTLDLFNIDLYNGNAEFMKVGAVASFIKSSDKVEVIKSKTLPIGVLDKADIEIEKRKLINGDIIVMVSDGAVDCIEDNVDKNNWLGEHLKTSKSNEPKDIACELLNKVINMSDFKVKDDITILVSKVYALY